MQASGLIPKRFLPGLARAAKIGTRFPGSGRHCTKPGTRTMRGAPALRRMP